FAVPMRWGTINLGVLDLYRKAPGPLRDTQLRDVMRAADLAVLMILWVEERNVVFYALAVKGFSGDIPERVDRQIGLEETMIIRILFGH
ncbi:MAG: hypothetical protein LC808_44930, partial [Actinobacteria bacterium]|nr:hypothetical protein [Actinomycetota bacterium]